MSIKSTLQITKIAFAHQFRFGGSYFGSLALAMILSLMLAVIIGIAFKNIKPDEILGFIANGGDIFSIISLSRMIGSIFGLILFLILVAGIFNYWVRFAVLGVERAIEARPREFFISMLINGLKLMGLLMFMAILNVIIGLLFELVGSVLNVVGLDASNSSATGGVLSMLFTMVEGIAAVVVSVAVYSAFSFTLTTTALGDVVGKINYKMNQFFAAYLVYSLVTFFIIFLAGLIHPELIALATFIWGLATPFMLPLLHGVCYNQQLTEV